MTILKKAVVVITLFFTGSFAANTLFTPSTQNGTRIIGLDVYEDSSLTKQLQTINWGTLRPGQNKTIHVYIKNTGNSWQQFTYNTTDWKPPEAQNYLVFSWNYLNTWVISQESIMLQFTLHVKQDVTNIVDFSFNIVVSGT